MKTEARFLLAVLLMLGVLVGTNRMFPPVVPEGAGLLDDSVGVASDAVRGGAQGEREGFPAPDSGPGLPAAASGAEATAGLPGTSDPFSQPRAAADLEVTVQGPLFRYRFSSLGARLVSGQLVQFQALNRRGPVQVVPDGAPAYFGQKLIVGSDTVDLSSTAYRVEPEAGLTLTDGGAPQTLRFLYEHPTSDFASEVTYTFDPSSYTVAVSGEVRGVDRALLVTDLGEGMAFAEADSAVEARSMAYVYNHLQDGVRSTLLQKAEPVVVEGPLIWAAFRSKFFVVALLPGEDGEVLADSDYLGGLLVRESTLPERVRVGAARAVRDGQPFGYRLFIGPQEYALLAALGQGMDEVNPYGWRLFRPIIRPIVSIIMSVLVFLHTQLSFGYGWVLIVFGVAMRIVLFPLNHKAMKAQLKNMAAQPLVKQIQDKYKDNPEKLQKEMMKLYKEHGFNPLAGCLPMLLPWPVLIALFFVFQNTIELRGVAFLWLPDLSAKDPLFILPVILALSMFLMQWVSLRSLDQENPQMKMMMYIMPPMMLFIFMNLASGLNLYYATANIATLPQQIWIARERQKMKGQPPLTLSSRE